MRDSSPSQQAVTIIIVVFAIVTLVWYALFLFSPSHIGNPWAYALLVIAEAIGIFQLLGAWVTILFSRPPPLAARAHAVRRKILTLGPQRVPASVVSVFLPVAGEPLDLIRETVMHARDMRVAHRTIILDDRASKDVCAMAQELGVEYLSRPVSDGHKAGNLNYGLQRVHTEFFAIFDSDHRAHSDFLLTILPHLIADPRLAFVATPQYYGNRDGFISGGDAQTQDIFYRHIQYGKNAFNAAFFVGTNAVFRRSAIDDVGGFYLQSHSEDIWTSLRLHEKGWRSFFLPAVLAVGLAPETIERLLRQQFRWARGGFEIFFSRNPLFNRSLSLDQKLQYFHSATFFFTGFSVVLFFLLPLLYAYLGMKPLEVPEGTGYWLAHFLPYYMMMFVASSHLLGRIPSWRTFVVALSAFPSHIAACFSALTGLNLRWSVTGVIRQASDHITAVTPHLIFLALSAGAIPLLLFSHSLTFMTVSMCGWLAFNSLILFFVCKQALPRFANARLSVLEKVYRPSAAFPVSA